MPRYRLKIEYDGSPYKGWQRQDDVPSVQGAIEDALAKLGEEGAAVQGSGRTDAGVHALGQIAHTDLQQDWTPFRLSEALNAHLRQSGQPVAILDCDVTDEEFHARFSATTRKYLYRIVDRRPRLALDRGRVWRVPYRIDADAMHAAAQLLVGKHDFATFRDTQCQAKSPIKTLDEVNVIRAGHEIHLTFRARSFLHKQVRSFTGSLVEVGMGKWDTEDMQAALDAKARTECGPVASPDVELALA